MEDLERQKQVLSVAVYRAGSLREVVVVAERLRQEGVPCAVSGHPEPWWVWQGWVYGRNRVLVDPEEAGRAREILKFLDHLDDAMAFETADHRPVRWRMFHAAIGLVLLIVFLFLAVRIGLG